MPEPHMLEKIMLALDNFESEEKLHQFMQERGKHFSIFKLGLEFFCRQGPQGIRAFYEKYQRPLFLDLKLHDIPNTVFHAIQSLKGLPVNFLTVHLTGGENMLKQAVKSTRANLPGCKLLGVSYLTSISDQDFSQIWNFTQQQTLQSFENLFGLAFACELDGVVLSPSELPLLKDLEKKFGKTMIKVTPGVRFDTGQRQDQQRVMTPFEATRHGADYLVMGRDWTQSTLQVFESQLKSARA